MKRHFVVQFAAALLVTLAGPSVAADWTVTSTADAHDAAPSDGICNDGTGKCTLRAALEQTSDTVINVIIPAGTYLLSLGDITLPPPYSVSLEGDTAATTILVGSPSFTLATAAVFGQGRVSAARMTLRSISLITSGFPGASLQGTDLITENSALRGGYASCTRCQMLNGGVSGRSAYVSDSVLDHASMSCAQAGCGVGNSTIRNNSGCAVLSGSPVSIDKTLIVGNGCGIQAYGGISSVYGAVYMTNSAVVGNRGTGIDTNTADIADSLIAGNAGAGILLINSPHVGKNKLLNSTIHGNDGVGVKNSGASLSDRIEIVQSTITANRGGGVYASAALWSATFESSILAGNTVAGAPADCTGSFESMGYNLVQSTSGCTLTGTPAGADLLGVDPMLGPLADNGGSTKTRLPQPGSPAIDAANPASTITHDQRGYLRPFGTRNDIGATEVGSELPRCGNGIVEFNEACDDDSGCCTANCQFVQDGTPCGDASAATCFQSACDRGACTSYLSEPATCVGAGAGYTSGTVSLKVAKGKTPSRSSVAWQLSDPPSTPAFGNPTQADGYTLCIVDLSESALVFRGQVLAGAGWKATRNGFAFKSRSGDAGGVRSLKLSAGDRTKLHVIARGVTIPHLPLASPIRTWLVRSDGTACWHANFGAGSTNDAKGYKGESTATDN